MAKSKELPAGHVLLEVVRGRDGSTCIVLGNHDTGNRIAGSKPWGGGTTIHQYVVDAAEIRGALDEYAPGVKE